MEEKKQILEMLKEGKISVEEANQLLEALNEPNTNIALKKNSKAKFIHIDVNDESDKVNVKLPISLAKIAGKMIPKILEKQNANPDSEDKKVNLEGIDINEIIEAIEDGQEGDLVNIKDGENTTVRIYIE